MRSGRAADDDVVSMSSSGVVSSRRPLSEVGSPAEGCASGAELIELDDSKALIGIVGAKVPESFVASGELEVRNRDVVGISFGPVVDIVFAVVCVPSTIPLVSSCGAFTDMFDTETIAGNTVLIWLFI